MPSVLVRYVDSLYLTRFLGVLFGLVLMVLALEAVVFGNEIAASRPDDDLAIFRYLALRTPRIISTYLGLSALVAALLTLTRLEGSRELQTIWGIGISPAGLVKLFVPAALIVGGVQLLVDDVGVPATAAELAHWNVGMIARDTDHEQADTQAMWFIADGHVVSAGSASGDRRQLSEVTLYLRSDEGVILGRVSAPSVDVGSPDWVFHDATILAAEPGAISERQATARYAIDFDTGLLDWLQTAPQDMPLLALLKLRAVPEFGIGSHYVLDVWIHRRVASVLTGGLAILLASVIAYRFGNRMNPALPLLIGIVAGFIYFIVDALSLSLGEAGEIPPVLAGWAGCLFVVAATIVLLAHGRMTERATTGGIAEADLPIELLEKPVPPKTRKRRRKGKIQASQAPI